MVYTLFMKTDLTTLFDDLMTLCDNAEAFYYVDQIGRDGAMYRVFTYRLASYTDFQHKNAIECRGHTFRKGSDGWKLASLPMHKFFNYGEHLGWKTELDLSTIHTVMDKLDGSLISTVIDSNGELFLKSKTSFISSQAADAANYLGNNAGLRDKVTHLVTDRVCTVNFEWTSPNNQIVIGYSVPKLTVLNVRYHDTGEYMSHNEIVEYFGQEHVVGTHDLPEDPAQFMLDAEEMRGIEGFVIRLDNGLWMKHKTAVYCTLHHLKDSINNPRRLWEACVGETSDDLRALFHADPLSIAKIINMEEKAATIYNDIHKTVHLFYAHNKQLSRKEYAIKGQAELHGAGIFSIAMNLYLGREANIREHMIVKYKLYDITDEGTNENE